MDIKKTSIDYGQLKAICADLKSYLKSIHGLYLDSISGFSLINQYLDVEQRELLPFLGENGLQLLNESSFSHKKIVGDDFAASGIHSPRVADIRSRTGVDGFDSDMIGKMCVVYLFSYWEMSLRKKVAEAKSIVSKDVQYDYWGDLCSLRNFIVHKSQKTRERLKRNKILTMWNNNKQVVITVKYFRRILLDGFIFHNQLYAESFPKRMIKI